MKFKIILSMLALTLLSFSCSKKSSDEIDEDPGEFGALVFYINEAFPCATIQISLTDANGNMKTGQLSGSAVTTGIPVCNQAGTYTFTNLAYGVCQFSYTCNGSTFNGQFTVNKDCFDVLMVN
jgi:hypothetical protein